MLASMADQLDAQPIGSGLTDAEGNAANYQGDHEGKGLSRLIRFFRVGKPRIAAFLGALTAQVQSIEDLAWTYYTSSRDLDTAAGVLLDRLGALVDEPRAGRSDTDYRAAIRVKILLLSCEGKIEQIYAICRLLSPAATVVITESWPAAFHVGFSTTGSLSVSYIASLLRIGKPAGVRLDVGLSGGAIGDTDGTPAGGAIGDTDGVPAGCAIGLAV